MNGEFSEELFNITVLENLKLKKALTQFRLTFEQMQGIHSDVDWHIKSVFAKVDDDPNRKMNYYLRHKETQCESFYYQLNEGQMLDELMKLNDNDLSHYDIYEQII